MQDVAGACAPDSDDAKVTALLERLKALAGYFGAHQPLLCAIAQLELRLGQPWKARTTVAGLVVPGEVARARWALHLTAHTYWLSGRLGQVWLMLSPCMLPLF